MAPGRRWRYVPPELVSVIALQLAAAGAGVAAAWAVTWICSTAMRCCTPISIR